MQHSVIEVGRLFIPGVAGKQVILKKIRYLIGKRNHPAEVREYQVLICDSDGVMRDSFVNGQPGLQSIIIQPNATDKQRVFARRMAYRLFFSTMTACASWTEDVRQTT